MRCPSLVKPLFHVQSDQVFYGYSIAWRNAKCNPRCKVDKSGRHMLKLTLTRVWAHQVQNLAHEQRMIMRGLLICGMWEHVALFSSAITMPGLNLYWTFFNFTQFSSYVSVVNLSWIINKICRCMLSIAGISSKIIKLDQVLEKRGCFRWGNTERQKFTTAIFLLPSYKFQPIKIRPFQEHKCALKTLSRQGGAQLTLLHG